MASHLQHSTFAELLTTVQSLVDQIKVLVTAVDDLRCEVEWQARNQAAARDDSQWTPVQHDAPVEPLSVDSPNDPQESAVADLPELSAAAQLQAYEALLAQGPRGFWRDDMAERDDFELPVGQIIQMDGQMWEDALGIRPAHVVDEGCCCEDGIGAPYLLAWEKEGEYFLRELSEDESVRLQTLCLAAVEEVRSKREDAEREKERCRAKQKGLF